MLIINGTEVIEGAYLLNCNQEQKQVLKTDNYTVTRNDTGFTLVMNSSSDKTFTLFTPATADIGKRFTFANINTGKLTIAVAGTGVVLNGGTATTGTMYNEIDDYTPTLTIEVTSALRWSVITAVGTWSTT